jgi:hypothetical protein
VTLGTRHRKAVSVWVRALAALAALLVAGEHSIASLHQALTAHEVCAEHGELVHAAEHEARTVSHASVPAVEPGASVEASHHHCGAVPAAPMRAPAPSAQTAILAPEPGIFAQAESFESVDSTPDVLAFAPKLSPPV